MKARSVKFLTASGLKNIWSHRLMSIASVGVLVACMLMMGIAVVLTFNIDNVVSTLEDQNVVLVFFDDDMSEEDAIVTCTKLQEVDNVKSVDFISKSEGLDRQKELMGNEYEELFNWIADENPLPDGAQVTMDDINEFDQTLVRLRAVDGVKSVRDQRNVAATLAAVRSIINKAGFWVIALLLVISLVIVSNTVKVTMYTRKLEINIMKAVGATNSFIRLPFIIEGMALGVIAGVLSTGLLYLLYKSAEQTFFETFSTRFVPFTSFGWYVFGGFMLMGILIGSIGSALSISKYLRYEGSDFNAID